jgi:hypothetical protein
MPRFLSRMNRPPMFACRLGRQPLRIEPVGLLWNPTCWNGNWPWSSARSREASSMPPSGATSSPILRPPAWAVRRPPNLRAICFAGQRIICGRALPSGSGFGLNSTANQRPPVQRGAPQGRTSALPDDSICNQVTRRYPLTQAPLLAFFAYRACPGEGTLAEELPPGSRRSRGIGFRKPRLFSVSPGEHGPVAGAS